MKVELSIISWNIWKGKYLGNVVKFLANQKVDVITLQEVTQYKDSDKFINTAEEIAHKLGYFFHYCKAFTTDRHTPVFDLGDAILSRYPIQYSACHVLSSLADYQRNSVTEPRNAVEIGIEVNGKKVSIITTHLGYSENFTESEFRSKQVENLVQLIQKDSVILTGDFNSLPESLTVKEVSKILTPADPVMQQPSYTHMKDPHKKQSRIDYIFSSLDITTKKFEILESDASDHFPLKAVFEV